MRLKKLANAGLNRGDTQGLVQASLGQCKPSASRRREEGTPDPALEQYRWMIEELRVPLFAQELKTILPSPCNDCRTVGTGEEVNRRRPYSIS